MPIVRVCVDCPAAAYFDYLDDHAIMDDIGRMVIVPFGRRRMLGVIIDIVDYSTLPTDKLKTVLCHLTDRPILSKPWLNLVTFSAEYYQYPLGSALFSVLPPPLKQTKLPIIRTPDTQIIFRWVSDKRPAVSKRAHAVRMLLEAFSERQYWSLQEAKQVHLNAAALLKRLENMGWLIKTTGQTAASSTKSHQLTEEYPLTHDQTMAVNTICGDLSSFRVFLLHGVTGSGKTEVYFQLIHRVLNQGGQILVLVPEINLTPQIQTRFQSRFPDTQIVSLHSGMANAKRLSYWMKAERGEADIVLGTRLAVFTPMPRLALVIVDEEHDPSYKQQDNMGYHARDLAIWRAQQSKAPVILGSATPSFESYTHAQTGRYTLLTLPNRAKTGATLPQVHLIDLRTHKLTDGFSEILLKTIEDTLERQEQVLVFLNRRGYAPVLYCPACDWKALCPACDVCMVYHATTHAMHCHLCGYTKAPERACPDCGNQDIQPVGIGTQRIEQTLSRYFPAARILRIDRDTTAPRHAFETMRHDIETGRADILVGTQMLAKGHDFANITLVCIINADHALYSPDYRATERLFSTLMQVSGRCGRANLPGHVAVQTRYPDHPVYQSLITHDYAQFASILLKERQSSGFPPYAFQAILRAEANTMADAVGFLKQAAALPMCSAHPDVFCYDPVPMSIARKAYQSRAQLLVESHSRAKLQRFLREWYTEVSSIKTTVWWRFDVDPIEF